MLLQLTDVFFFFSLFKTRWRYEVLHQLRDLLSFGRTAEPRGRLLPQPHQRDQLGQGVWNHGAQPGALHVTMCRACFHYEKITFPLAGQITQSHCVADSAASGVCKVEIVAGGCSYAAGGAVQGGVPVLLKLNNSVYRQPVSLAGHLLVFKASANPQLLSSVAGKKVSRPVRLKLGALGSTWFFKRVGSPFQIKKKRKCVFNPNFNNQLLGIQVSLSQMWNSTVKQVNW